MQRWHRRVAGIGGLVVVAALAGCGGGAEPAAQPTEAPPPTELTVTVTGAGGSGSGDAGGSSGAEPTGEARGSGAKDPQRWTLTCSPDGGTHPHPDQACAALTRNAAALQPVAKGQICTEIYGGPQRATVTGTWAGKPVDARLSRSNGCEIARWSELTGLLPTVS